MFQSFTTEMDRSTMGLSTAARRLLALLVGDADSAAAEPNKTVLHVLAPLLAWLHQSLRSVLNAATGELALTA